MSNNLLKKKNKYNTNKEELFIKTFYIQKTCRFISFNKSLHKKKVFILLPPPNITGKLHFGHVFNFIIQDVIYRIYESNGYKVIWEFGFDHAGIATENKILGILRKLKLICNEKYFNYLINKWVLYDKNVLLKQINLLNIKLNTNVEHFTLNKKFNFYISKYLVFFLKKKLIYYKDYIVNYCFHCKTTLSDEEINISIEEKKTYFLKYFKENSDEYILIATTKPETIIGDVAVLYNSKFNIKNNLKVKVPLINRIINVIKDDNKFLDDNYGSGFMKISPFFDIKDYNICLEKKISIIKPLNLNNLKITVGYFKEKIFNKEFNEYIINELHEKGFIEKIVSNKGKVYRCYRCNDKTGYIISGQFFFNLKKIVNNKFYKYLNNTNFLFKAHLNSLNLFLNKIKDWCISRQISWGHKIKLKVCFNCNDKIYTFNFSYCTICKKKLFYHNYVLDTWFSSALYHIIIYPNNIDFLVTGKDILFFWVFKMLIMSYVLNKNHFNNIFLHGVIRDKQNRKLSKSLNNSPDFSDILLKFDSDILRMNFLFNCGSFVNDFIFDEENIKICKKKINKLFSIYKFLYKDFNNYSLYTFYNDFCYFFLKEKILIKSIIFFYFNYFYNKLYLFNKIKKLSSIKFNLSYIFKEKINFMMDVFSMKFIELSKIFSINKYFLIILWNCYLLNIYPFLPYYSNFFLKKNLLKINFITKNSNNIMLLFHNFKKYKFKKIFFYNFFINFFMLCFNKIKNDIKDVLFIPLNNLFFSKAELVQFLSYYKINSFNNILYNKINGFYFSNFFLIISNVESDLEEIRSKIVSILLDKYYNELKLIFLNDFKLFNNINLNDYNNTVYEKIFILYFFNNFLI